MKIAYVSAVIALTTSALNLNPIEDNAMQYAEVADLEAFKFDDIMQCMAALVKLNEDAAEVL